MINDVILLFAVIETLTEVIERLGQRGGIGRVNAFILISLCLFFTVHVPIQLRQFYGTPFYT